MTSVLTNSFIVEFVDSATATALSAFDGPKINNLLYLESKQR